MNLGRMEEYVNEVDSMVAKRRFLAYLPFNVYQSYVPLAQPVEHNNSINTVSALYCRRKLLQFLLL